MSMAIRRRGSMALRHASYPAPIAAYSYSETSGTTTADITGNGHTLTISSFGVGHQSKGTVADSSHTAASYLGTLFVNPTALSILTWIEPIAHSGTPDIITLTDSTEATYVGIYWVSDTTIRLYLADSAGYQESDQVEFTTGAWTHAAITVSQTSVVLYLNDVVATTLTRSGTATLNTMDHFFLGGNNAKAGGSYSDTYLFNTTLSQAAVGYYMRTPTNYVPNISVPTPVVAWRADEGSGTSVIDYSGNGHTGIAASDGWVTGNPPHAFAAAGDSGAPGVKLEGTTLLSNSKTVSIMCTVKAITLTGSGDLLEFKSDHTSVTYMTIFRPNANHLRVEIRDVNGTITDTVDYPATLTGVSNNIAATLSTTALRLYLNGELAVEVPVAGTGDLGVIQLFYAGGTDTKNNQGAVNDIRMFVETLNHDTIRYLAATPV